MRTRRVESEGYLLNNRLPGSPPTIDRVEWLTRKNLLNVTAKNQILPRATRRQDRCLREEQHLGEKNRIRAGLPLIERADDRSGWKSLIRHGDNPVPPAGSAEG